MPLDAGPGGVLSLHPAWGLLAETVLLGEYCHPPPAAPLPFLPFLFLGHVEGGSPAPPPCPPKPPSMLHWPCLPPPPVCAGPLNENEAANLISLPLFMTRPSATTSRSHCASSTDYFNLIICLFWSINSLSNQIVTEHNPTLMSIGLRAISDNVVCHN